MIRFSYTIILVLLSGFCPIKAQTTNTSDTIHTNPKGKLTIEGYIDLYYGYNFNEPAAGSMPYLVSSTRHNTMAINLTNVAIKYQSDNFRARFIPGFGTYMNDNYASEPEGLKNLVETNIGVRLSKKSDIWIDAGILASPYTNESAFSKDQLMYTRSLSAENTPYYLNGVKLSLPINKSLTGYLYLINGWQQIQDNNSGKSLGTQLEYRPNKKVLLNWNTYSGSESSKLNPNYRTRYFSDLYLIWSPTAKWDISSCVYYGQQAVKGSQSSNWYQANLIGSYRLNKQHSIAGRLEYFNDPKNALLTPITIANQGFKVSGAGVCWNVRLNDHALFRFETRALMGEQKLFIYKGTLSHFSTLAIANLTAYF